MLESTFLCRSMIHLIYLDVCKITCTGRLCWSHATSCMSPDLNPCDFWLWDYMKLHIYLNRLTSVGMLNNNFQRHFLIITTYMLYSDVHNFVPRLQILLRDDGQHVENLFWICSLSRNLCQRKVMKWTCILFNSLSCDLQNTSTPSNWYEINYL